jgi:hypothetical protein
MEEKDTYIESFGRKPRGKRTLGKPRCRWEDNIKIGLNGSGRVWTGSSGSG